MTLSSPSVSVVIATRDRPEMLAEAIGSVLDQEYDGPVEVIVVFDQSDPDPSLAHDDGRRSVRVVANRRATGLAGARNTGIELSTADLVAFCDDDDLWLPGKLRQQVALLRGGRFSLVSTGIEVVYDGTPHPRSLDTDRVTFAALLADRHTELHPSTFLAERRTVVDQIGLVSEEVPGGFGEDYEFLLRAARHQPIGNVPEPLVRIRWSGGSYFFRRWETMADGLGWLLRHYPEFESQPSGSARVRGQIAFARAAQGQRREAVSWAWSAFRRNPRELRVPLALAVAGRVVPAGTVMEWLHRRGRGI